MLAGRPPAPCGVAPWLRRAPSVVCGCTITEMGHTHDPYGGVRDLVLELAEIGRCHAPVSPPQTHQGGLLESIDMEVWKY